MGKYQFSPNLSFNKFLLVCTISGLFKKKITYLNLWNRLFQFLIFILNPLWWLKGSCFDLNLLLFQTVQEHSNLSKQFTYLSLNINNIFAFLFSLNDSFCQIPSHQNNTIFIYTSFQKSILPVHSYNIQIYSSKIQISFFFLWLIKFLWLVSDLLGLQFNQ